ncbi:hypothetical protein OG871_12745 [Kitasatospora sp. NBC_00374]|uniref:hypothetical protein n=1 Tax=Kitasatospora sp. NBC_00374 TaxID=2975964 RepID=UPI0030E00BFD
MTEAAIRPTDTPTGPAAQPGGEQPHGRRQAARRAAAVLFGAWRRRPVPEGRPIQESDYR